MMGKPAVSIVLSKDERSALLALSRARKSQQALAQRARIVLAAADGLENTAICAKLNVVANTVAKWRRRFAAQRLDGLYDEPRPGAPREIGDDAIAEMVRMTLESLPKNATHWSLRKMGRAVGHSPSTIHRIWKAFGLQRDCQEFCARGHSDGKENHLWQSTRNCWTSYWLDVIPKTCFRKMACWTT